MEFPATFENQEQFDQAIQGRITREREKVKRESGSNDGLEAAQERVAELERDIQTRDARAVLQEMGVGDEARQDRIIRLVDLEGDASNMKEAFKNLHADMPEVFPADATVTQQGLDTTGSGDATGPLTEAQVHSMSPEEINSNWDRVKAFIGGER